MVGALGICVYSALLSLPAIDNPPDGIAGTESDFRRGSDHLPPLDLPPALAPYEPWLTEAGKDWDWIRLYKGDWIRGRIIEMRDGRLDFRSPSFGELDLGWSRVAEVHSSGPLTWVTKDFNYVRGTSVMHDDRIVVTTDTGSVTLERSSLLSVVGRSVSTRSFYLFKATLGVDYRSGNTNTASYSAFARFRRIEKFTRGQSEYLGSFGLLDNVPNIHKHRVSSQLDVFAFQFFFVRPIIGEFQFDEFNNLVARYIVASGAGVRPLADDAWTLNLDVVTGYAEARYLSVFPGDPPSRNAALVRTGIDLDWELSDDVDLELEWASSLTVTDIAQTFHRGAFRLSIDIASVFELSAGVTFDRQETPQRRADGSVPTQNDIATSLGIGVDLE